MFIQLYSKSKRINKASASAVLFIAPLPCLLTINSSWTFSSSLLWKSAWTLARLPNPFHRKPILRMIDTFDFLFTFHFSSHSVPKKSQSLGFEVPKFWHSISSDAELLDEELEEDVEETTTHHEPYPFFEEEQTQLNDTTQLGNDVYLHCRVQNLGEKTVSGKILFSNSSHTISDTTRFSALQGIVGAAQRRSTAFDNVWRIAV